MENESSIRKIESKRVQLTLSEDEFLLLRNYIMDNCGILIPYEKAYLFETRLSSIVDEAGAKSFFGLYRTLVSSPDTLMHQKVIDAMTTNETLWFRDAVPWEYMEKVAIPGFVKEILSGKKKTIRIWSAAVSTGQEIYSTVMCVDDYLRKNRVIGVNLSNFEFFATDICSHVVDAAKKGSYDKNSMERGLPRYYKDKYFAKNGMSWDIDPRIRDSVKFLKFNLINDYHIFGMYDIILCRYVLIYFSDSAKKGIIERMNGSLTDGGVLLTGNYVINDAFEKHYDIKRYKNMTYYTKKHTIHT